MVEDFIPSAECSVEGICVRGTFHLLAVTGKRTSGFPYFYETGHLLPDPAQESGSRFGTYLQEIVSALGIDTAPVHAEVKASDDAIELIEIHTRFGGDLVPALMEKALDIRGFGYFYDALLYGRLPEPPSGPARVAGVRFLCRPLEDAGLRIPRPPHGVRAEMVVGGGDGHEPGALDNIRIPNQRYGLIVFTAPSHEDAEGFAAQLDNDWQDDS
nr:ATP-grasp domain-containing protein [Nocardiopsis algeriensis]